jgi:hypothetical protein
MKSIRYIGITNEGYAQLKSDVSKLSSSAVKNAHMGLVDNVLARAAIILKEQFVETVTPATTCDLKINAAYTKSGNTESITVTGMVYAITDHATASVFEILDANR